MTSNNQKGERQSCKATEFFMMLKLGSYKFKLEHYNVRMLNAINTITTKKRAIKYTQKKMKKNLNISLQKNN